MGIYISCSPAQDSTLLHFGVKTFCFGQGEELQLKMTPVNNGALPRYAGFWSDSKQGGTVRKRTKALDRDLRGGSASYFLYSTERTRALNNPPPSSAEDQKGCCWKKVLSSWDLDEGCGGSPMGCSCPTAVPITLVGRGRLSCPQSHCDQHHPDKKSPGQGFRLPHQKCRARFAC